MHVRESAIWGGTASNNINIVLMINGQASTLRSNKIRLKKQHKIDKETESETDSKQRNWLFGLWDHED